MPGGRRGGLFRRCLTKPLQSRKPPRTQPVGPGTALRLAQTQEDAGLPAAAIASLHAIGCGPTMPKRMRILASCLPTRATSKRHSEPAPSGHAQARLRARLEQPRLGAAQSGQLNDAVDAIRKALALQPDYAFGHATLGLLERDWRRRSRRGFASRGAAAASRSARSDGRSRRAVAAPEPPRRVGAAVRPRDERARRQRGFQLGSVLAERGEPVPARDAFARALAADPEASRGARAPSDAPDAVRLGGAHRGGARRVRRRSDGARRIDRVLHA